MSDETTKDEATPEAPKPKRKAAQKKPTRTQRKPASEHTIETGSSPDEVMVREDVQRPIEDTGVEHEPLPAVAEELERIRAEEDEARAAQEEEADRDFELKQQIATEKDARDSEAKLAFGQPPGDQVDERGDVVIGDCLACGEPITAEDSYMKFAAGITHMHECATAYHNALRDKVAASRDVSHEPNSVRHPNLAERHEQSSSDDGSRATPLNVAQGTSALVGYGALADDAPLPAGQTQHGDSNARIEPPEVDDFEQPIRDAIKADQEAAAEFAARQQEAGEYVKNP